MEELVRLVSEKTGFSEEKSRLAVEVVTGYLKERLPAPIAHQIETVLNGTSMVSGVGGVAKGLDNIFGSK